jgi:hypothetical protein
MAYSQIKQWFGIMSPILPVPADALFAHVFLVYQYIKMLSLQPENC